MGHNNLKVKENTMAKTKTEQLQDIVEAYRSSGEVWPATAKQIGAWAIREGHWKAAIKSQIDQCAMEIASAMRQEYFIDPQGREVRKKHPYRDITELSDGKCDQQFLWIDMLDTRVKHEEVEKAFQYGRKLIVGDCKQLKTSVDSYNDNNKHGKYIEMNLNFIDDMAESEQPTVYPGL
jgi:hypothetical protein